MKTLLQINTNVGWNSTGRIAEDIGKAAIAHGWLSTIAYGRNMNGAPASTSNLVRVGHDADIVVHGIGTRLFDRHGLYSRRPTQELIKRIEEINPDIIHLHNIHGYYLNYQELFSYIARTGIPTVWTLHDCWPFTGHCAYFDMADCDRWLNGCSRCSLKRMYPASLWADNSAENYALKREAFTSVENLHIVAVSQWLKSVIDRSFLEKFPTYVIYNGIEVGAESARRVKRERLVLGAASKWDPRKGLDTFVQLREHLPSDFRMVLIGLTRGQIRSLPRGIEGVERINERGAMYDWFRRATVYVNPSLSETLSVTNLEAQACGTPVVAFDSGGMSETITDRTGLLVDAGDIRSLASAVHEIAGSPRRFSPSACRAHIEKRFNKAINYKRYIDLYDSILAAERIHIPEITEA